MDGAEACDLIWFESCEEGGVVVALRMGDDPGPDRMRRLLLALRSVFEELRGLDMVDRRLAYALHGLAVYPESQILSWASQGRAWRNGIVSDEIPAVRLAVESIFADEWQDLHAELKVAPDRGGIT